LTITCVTPPTCTTPVTSILLANSGSGMLGNSGLNEGAVVGLGVPDVVVGFGSPGGFGTPAGTDAIAGFFVGDWGKAGSTGGLLDAGFGKLGNPGFLTLGLPGSDDGET